MATKKPKTQRIYIIEYNDCFGNGDQKSTECAVTSKAGFKSWLAAHNKARKADGEEPECASEFDLKETILIY